jgi:hypothetical protein
LVQKAQSITKRNKKSSDIEFLDACDPDDEGFIEGDVNTGKVLSKFIFETDTAIQTPVQARTNELFNTQPQNYSSAPRGLTPPINGENFTVKRSYAMRPSTVRKLNALKAEHPDVNMLFNTIVDMAISHYYSYIFNESGTFSIQEEKKINS